MFGLSHGPELLILVVLALIVFGPKRLPEIGSSLGKGIREFKKSTQEDDTTTSSTPPAPQQIPSAHQTTDVRVPDATTVRTDREAG